MVAKFWGITPRTFQIWKRIVYRHRCVCVCVCTYILSDFLSIIHMMIKCFYFHCIYENLEFPIYRCNIYIFIASLQPVCKQQLTQFAVCLRRRRHWLLGVNLGHCSVTPCLKWLWLIVTPLTHAHISLLSTAILRKCKIILYCSYISRDLLLQEKFDAWIKSWILIGLNIMFLLFLCMNCDKWILMRLCKLSGEFSLYWFIILSTLHEAQSEPYRFSQNLVHFTKVGI
jgi:hypothetical protein